MALSDRDYARGTEPGFHMTAPTSATVQLVLITGAVYLAQFAYAPLTDALSLHDNWYTRPWQAYQLLTYGFLHDKANIGHILLNMLLVWMFGRELEQRYGRVEFLAFYLVAIVAAGIGWSLSELPSSTPAALLGASGGATAVIVLFALLYPHRQVLLMFVIPVPMWVVAILGVLMDLSGAMSRENAGNVAFTAHLSGAAFALLYYRFNWQLSSWFTQGRAMFPRRPSHGLRVHEPDEGEPVDDLSVKVDAILQKIQEQGQGSLTWSERRLLERASREYQQKRK